MDIDMDMQFGGTSSAGTETFTCRMTDMPFETRSLRLQQGVE